MPVLIENPVINSPFEEPQRHFRFADNGITDEIVPGRRRSTYFIPIIKLYSTKSRPFDRPETGKIAVKVINHYGDEVLKVFGVA